MHVVAYYRGLLHARDKLKGTSSKIMLFNVPVMLCSNSPTYSQLCSLFYTYYAPIYNIIDYRDYVYVSSSIIYDNIIVQVSTHMIC